MNSKNSTATCHKPVHDPAASALEHLPHVIKCVEELWGKAEFEPYVNHLVMESRDGKRQGLPWEMAQELFFLLELGISKRALDAEELTGAPFPELFALYLTSSVIASQFGEGIVDLRTVCQPDKSAARRNKTTLIKVSANGRDSDRASAMSALEQLPHVSFHVRRGWGKSDFEPYVNHLVMESRDGKRQGLPWEMAQELFFLLELCVAKRALLAEELTGVPFTEMFTRFVAKGITAGQFGLGAADHWSEAVAHRDAARMERRLT